MFEELFELTIDGAFASKDEFNEFTKEASNEEIFSVLKEGSFSDFNEFNSVYGLKKKDDPSASISQEEGMESTTEDPITTTSSGSSEDVADDMIGGSDDTISVSELIDKTEGEALPYLRRELADNGFSLEETGMFGNAILVTDNITGEETEIDLKPIEFFGASKEDQIKKIQELRKQKTDPKRRFLSDINQLDDIKREDEGRLNAILSVGNSVPGVEVEYGAFGEVTVSKNGNSVTVNTEDRSTSSSQMMAQINKFLYDNLTEEEALEATQENTRQIIEDINDKAKKELKIDVSDEAVDAEFYGKDYFKNLFKFAESSDVEINIDEDEKKRLEEGVLKAISASYGEDKEFFNKESISNDIEKILENNPEAKELVEKYNAVERAKTIDSKIKRAKKLAKERVLEQHPRREQVKRVVDRKYDNLNESAKNTATTMEMAVTNYNNYLKDVVAPDLKKMMESDPELQVVVEQDDQGIVTGVMYNKETPELNKLIENVKNESNDLERLILKSDADLIKANAEMESVEGWIDATKRNYNIVDNAYIDLKNNTKEIFRSFVTNISLAQEAVGISGPMGMSQEDFRAGLRAEQEKDAELQQNYFETMRDYKEAYEEGSFGRFAFRQFSGEVPNMGLAIGMAYGGGAIGLSRATISTLTSTAFGLSAMGSKYNETTKRQEMAQKAEAALAALESVKDFMPKDDYYNRKYELERAKEDLDISSTDKTLAVVGSGLIEFGVSKIIGTVPNAAKIRSDFFKPAKYLDDINRSNVRAVLDSGWEITKRTAGGVIEETSIELLNQFNNYAFLGDNVDISQLDDIALTSIITEGAMNVPSVAYSTLISQTNINRYREDVEGIVSQITNLKEALNDDSMPQGVRSIIHSDITSKIKQLSGITSNMEADALLLGADNLKNLLMLSGMEKSLFDQAGVESDDNYEAINLKVKNHLKTLDKSEAKKYQDKINYISKQRKEITGNLNYEGAIEKVFGEKGVEVSNTLDPKLTPKEKYVEVYKQLREELNNNAKNEYDAIQEQKTRDIPDAEKVIVYRGTALGNRSDKDGVTYVTPNRDYAAFYESGTEKPKNIALEELEKLKEPTRGEAVPINIETETASLSSLNDLGYNFTSLNEARARLDEIGQKQKPTPDEQREATDIASELPESYATQEQLDAKYEAELEEYNRRKAELEAQAGDYLSPRTLTGNSISLGIDFSSDSPRQIFEKLKALGIAKEFKGGNFLDRYHSDLVAYAKENNIDYYNGIVGGVQGSLNEKPQEIIVINNESLSKDTDEAVEETEEVAFVTPETSSNYANMTEDDKGNFVFFHKGKKGYKTIKPGTGESAVTSREESRALGKVGGLAMYYTDKDASERQGAREAQYAVTVPKEKVYDFNVDPLNLIDEARNRHAKEFPGQAFDINTQVAYVTKIAGERGFDMVVTEWAGKTRAQSTKELTPVDLKEFDGATVTKDFDNTYESNVDKGFKPVIPAKKSDVLKKAYDAINEERDNAQKYDELYHLRNNPEKYTQEEITELIENSDLSDEVKQQYRDALEFKEESRRSEPLEKTEPKTIGGAPRGHYINVGMVAGKTNKPITKKQIIGELPKDVKVLEDTIKTVESEGGTENTLSLKLSRPLTNGEMRVLLDKTEQMAIPQLTYGNGTMFGTKDWGDFNPDFFAMPNGKQLSEVINEQVVTEETKTGIDGVITSTEIRERSEASIKAKKKKDASITTRVREKLLDRQARIKGLLKGINSKQAKQALAKIVTKAGASGYASFRFKEAENKIYKGLSNKDQKILDEIIYESRIISINKNRADRGMDPYTGIEGYNEVSAQRDLDAKRRKLGDKKFNELKKRSDIYFQEMNKSLKRMFDSGLISEEVYNQLKDLDYSPIKTIKYIIPENSSTEEIDRVAISTGVTRDAIKKLGDSNINDIITDSKWLLATNLSMIEAKIFENRMLNSFEEAINSATETEKIALNEYILDNPVIGKYKDGRPKRKYDENYDNINYTKVFYKKDGVDKYFVMKKIHAEQLLDVKMATSDTSNVISKVTGTQVLRFFATSGNPLFIVGNTAVDFSNILFLSDTYSNFKLLGGAELAYDFIKNSLGKIFASDSYNKSYNEFMEHGGSIDYLSVDGLKALQNLDVGRKPLKKAVDIVKFYGRVLSYLGETSEISFRIAVYEKSKSNQLKELGRKPTEQEMEDIMFEAAREARETIDFSQGGSATKAADKTLPYLNAATQGLRKGLDYANNNPAGFASSMLQASLMSGGLMAGSLLMLLSALDDEDEIDEVLERISVYEKSNYHIIFTGKKDEDGEYEYYRVKKLPTISVFTTLAEQLVTKAILNSRGIEYDVDGDIMEKSLKSAMPIVPTPKEFLQRNPLLSSVITYNTNYDFFYEKPIFQGPKGKKVAPSSEGLYDPKVNQIYKDWGQATGMSPARSKAALEKIITSESTNPVIGLIYSGYDAAFKEDTPISEDFNNAKESLLKNVSKKVKRKTNKNLKVYKERAEIEEQEMIIETDIYNKEQQVYRQISEKHKNNEELTKRELRNIVEENFDKKDWKKYYRKYYIMNKKKDVDRGLLDILYEDTPEVQALKLFKRFGDSLDSEEMSELKEVMRSARRKVSKKAYKIYKDKYKK
jgi:hypothetical protein